MDGSLSPCDNYFLVKIVQSKSQADRGQFTASQHSSQRSHASRAMFVQPSWNCRTGPTKSQKLRDSEYARQPYELAGQSYKFVRQSYEFVWQPVELANFSYDCQTTRTNSDGCCTPIVPFSCVCHSNSQNAFSCMLFFKPHILSIDHATQILVVSWDIFSPTSAHVMLRSH